MGNLGGLLKLSLPSSILKLNILKSLKFRLYNHPLQRHCVREVACSAPLPRDVGHHPWEFQLYRHVLTAPHFNSHGITSTHMQRVSAFKYMYSVDTQSTLLQLDSPSAF